MNTEVKLPKYPQPWKDFKDLTADACMLALPSAAQARKYADKLAEVAADFEKFEKGLIADRPVWFDAFTSKPVRLATPNESREYGIELERCLMNPEGEALFRERGDRFVVDGKDFGLEHHSPVYMEPLRVEMSYDDYEFSHGKPHRDVAF